MTVVEGQGCKYGSGLRYAVEGSEGGLMISITDGKWIADLGAMCCRNIEKRMVVCFQRKGKTFEATLQDMPIELLTVGGPAGLGAAYQAGGGGSGGGIFTGMD